MIGQRFGNYVVTRVIGVGGMGTVYEAEHPGIGRKVAVKILKPEFSKDELLLNRFMNEARAANAIRHPNIIEVLDLGTTEAGVAYLMMELLQGESLLARQQRKGRLRPPEAMELISQTAAALAAAHQQGITHRDLKPDNVFIVPDATDPAKERVKVLDFGIAKLQVGLKADSHRTRTGTILGTPIYMSPEQCLGNKTVDHRSDLYSLGVMFFEMLCGHPPFVSEGLGALVNMHINEPAPSVRDYNPAIPEVLAAIVARLLRKKPEDRFPTMLALRHALQEAGGPAVLATPNFPGSANRIEGATPVAPTMVSPLPAAPSAAPAAENTASRIERTARVPLPHMRTVIMGVGCVVIAVAVGLGWRAMDGHGPVVTPAPPPAEAPHPDPAPPLVHIRIDSTPHAARIVRASDNVLLGTTPETLELRASSETLAIRIEKEGFRPQSRALPIAADLSDTVVLKPVAPAAKPARSNARPPARPVDNEPAKI